MTGEALHAGHRTLLRASCAEPMMLTVIVTGCGKSPGSGRDCRTWARELVAVGLWEETPYRPYGQRVTVRYALTPEGERVQASLPSPQI